MSQISAVFLYGIPEDNGTNVVRILESATENGNYTLVASLKYLYGQKASEYTSADSTKWYKIQFYNSTSNVAGAISDPVYGGDYDKSKPFVAISTSFDGSGYATVSELMAESHLNPTDVSIGDCQKALKTSRAYLDLVTSGQGIEKFTRYFDKDVSRRKYNAYIALMKECEIKFALSLIYKDLADDYVMKSVRDGLTGSSSISVGQTSLQQDDPTNLKLAEFLDTQASRYASAAASLIQTLLPTSIDLSYSENTKRYSPVEWTSFANAFIGGSNQETLELETVTLTGHGIAMNGAFYVFEGQTPVAAISSMSDAMLTVNGINYPIESFINLDGSTRALTTENTGFVINLSGSPSVKWNYTTANGGFDLNNTDIVQLKYWA